MGQLAKTASVPAFWMLGFREGLDNSKVELVLISTDKLEMGRN